MPGRDNPNPSPQWVRETLVEDLADIDRGRGRLPDSRALESIVDEELRQYEALKREAKPKSRIKRPPEAGLDKQDPAKDLAERKGWQLRRDYEPPKPQTVAHSPNRCACGGGRCKYCKMWVRISTLLQMHPDYRRRVKQKLEAGLREGRPKAASLSWDLFLFPRFAQMIMEAHSTRQRKLGEYEGKGPKECDRILRRKLEDIADKSTSVLGPWWVK